MVNEKCIFQEWYSQIPLKKMRMTLTLLTCYVGMGRAVSTGLPRQDYMLYSFCTPSLRLPNALVSGGHPAMLFIGTETARGIF